MADDLLKKYYAVVVIERYRDLLARMKNSLEEKEGKTDGKEIDSSHTAK